MSIREKVSDNVYYWSVQSNNRISPPKEIREALNLKANDNIRIELVGEDGENPYENDTEPKKMVIRKVEFDLSDIEG